MAAMEEIRSKRREELITAESMSLSQDRINQKLYIRKKKLDETLFTKRKFSSSKKDQSEKIAQRASQELDLFRRQIRAHPLSPNHPSTSRNRNRLQSQPPNVQFAPIEPTTPRPVGRPENFVPTCAWDKHPTSAGFPASPKAKTPSKRLTGSRASGATYC